jgi:hypothetical protein
MKDLLSYDPPTGVITWKVSRGRVKAGDVAGNASHRYGYVAIRINGKRYYAHRIAWELYYGEPPSQTIDHINGDTSDNRICNLRDVDSRTNQSARFRDRQLPTGAYPTRNGQRYQATAKIDGKSKAHQAYLEAIQ